MPASKAVPLHGKTCLSQRVTEAFGSDVGKNVIQRAVTLEDRQPLPFAHERPPNCLSQQVPGELHESSKGIVGMEHGITGEHGAL